MVNRFLAFGLMLVFAVCALPRQGDAASVDSISLREQGQETQIILSVSSEVAPKLFTLANPDRLVVDLPPVQWQAERALPEDYKGSLINGMRSGWFNPQTYRLVFDVAEPVKYKVSSRADALAITVAPVAERAAVAPVKSALKTKDSRYTSQTAKERQRPTVLDRDETEKPKLEMAAPIAANHFKQVPVPVLKASRGSKSKTKGKEKSFARKPIIVIDAGHGGVDPGTIGVDGGYEKDVTLEYAKALRYALLSTGRYQVALTRNDDRFILLRGRVEVARKLKGDLFISLHADSHPDQNARGLSIYTLSETASDKEAEALAARENKVDLIAGIDLSKESKDVAGILIDLAQRETKNKSVILADSMVSRLEKGRVVLLPHAHRFAGFAVLKALDIPSVLVEIGFLSNPREEKIIKTDEHRARVAFGLAAGIDAYFKSVATGKD